MAWYGKYENDSLKGNIQNWDKKESPFKTMTNEEKKFSDDYIYDANLFEWVKVRK